MEDKSKRPALHYAGPGIPEKKDGGIGFTLSTRPLMALAGGAPLIPALLVAFLDLGPPGEIKALLGFYLFFIAPGWFLECFLFPYKPLDLLERIPLSVALSMGVWAFPGLAAYYFGVGLAFVTAFEIAVICILCVLALASQSPFYLLGLRGLSVSPLNKLGVMAVTVLLAAAAAWIGSFRGTMIDWDYFNYISAVNKLVAWNAASLAHFAYADAPPDPIHSYNVWALQWAMISRLFEIGPIELYAKSGFAVIPAAALAFYAMASRLLGVELGRTSFFLYVSYHVVYGGLVFLGRASFYPADSQWLLVFPACVHLFAVTMETRGVACLFFFEIFFGLALAVLGMSITHVLWGLCFYVTVLSFAGLTLLERLGLWTAYGSAWKGGKKVGVAAVSAMMAAPLALALANFLVKSHTKDLEGFTPLLGGGADFSPWVYAAFFVLIPSLLLAAIVWPYRKRGSKESNSLWFAAVLALSIALLCLVVASPYVLARKSAIDAATNWAQFGRNPYRSFITSGLFTLNPFLLSLDNPNVTFYPIYLLGYAGLPLLWYLSRRRKNAPAFFLAPPFSRMGGPGKHGPTIALAALVAVPLICFHPVLATLFSEYFSMGYLRRLLRLGAIFSFLPAAILVHAAASLVVQEARRPLAHVALTLCLSMAIAFGCARIKSGVPYYNDLLRKSMAIAEKYPKDTLIYESTPFQAIKESGWFGKDDVLFTDAWTGYRLTAYLPQFVAVQHKPGTGVADQDERRLLEAEFFDHRTKMERVREILGRFNAKGVIINRDPLYQLRGFACGHPEAVGKLYRDPGHFEPLYDDGRWVIFRYLPDPARGPSRQDK